MRLSLQDAGRALRSLLVVLALLACLPAPAWAPPFKPSSRMLPPASESRSQPAARPEAHVPAQAAPPVARTAPETASPQSPPSPTPQDPALGKAERGFRVMKADFDQLKAEFARPSLTTDQLAGIRRGADELRTRTLFAQEELKTPIADRTQQLKRIGEVPAGQSEDPSLAATRQQLFDSVATLEAVNRQVGLLSLEVEQLVGRVTTRQRDEFLNRLLEPGRSVVNPSLWIDGALDSGLVFVRTRALLANWWLEASPGANVGILLMAPAVMIGLFLLYRILRRWLTRRFGAVVRAKPPDDAERLWRVVRGVLLAWAATAAAIVVTYLAFKTANALTPRFEQLFEALAVFVFYSVVLSVAAHRLAAPGMPEWRVIDLDDQAAGQFALLASVAACLSAGTEFLVDLQTILFLPVSLAVAQSALVALLMTATISATLVLVANQQGLPPQMRGGTLYFGWTRSIAPLIWVILSVSVVALLAGYVALAAFLTQQIIDTAYIVAGLFVVHHLSDAIVASSLDPQSKIGHLLRRITRFGDRAIARLGLFLRTVIDLSLVVVGLPLLFINWAVTWIDFGSWVNSAIVGFEIGNVTISVGSILIGLAVLAGGVGIVKLFTLWLDRRVLARTTLDVGVRNSIQTGASYAGFLIVAGLALTSAGLDFTNFAIVAGALGVGIGFGLQSIVNNFVSGLILLAERPIKVGDWIKVAGGEGIVKRINVRSTEIETFDKCAIIVPNSSLISDVVSNWTHGDVMGRVRVPVGVSYGTDPRQVEKILLECARKHERMLAFPQSFVRFRGFGGSSLDFDLFGYVEDVNAAAETASDLRYEILRRFTEAGIEIPFAQSDVRIKDLDQILQALKPRTTSRSVTAKKGKE